MAAYALVQQAVAASLAVSLIFVPEGQAYGIGAAPQRLPVWAQAVHAVAHSALAVPAVADAARDPPEPQPSDEPLDQPGHEPPPAEALEHEHTPPPPERLETALTVPVFRLNTDVAEVVLTFDDGPGRYTEHILDILQTERVPAAFFWLTAHPKIDLAPAVLAAGHQIGTHTVHHQQLPRLTAAALQNEIVASQAALAAAAGEPIVLFRPPYGAYNDEVLTTAAAAGLATIMWDVDSRDWDRADRPEEIVTAVMSAVQPGSIILLHERPQTVAALPALIAALRDAGYSFRLLPVPDPPQSAAQASDREEQARFSANLSGIGPGRLLLEQTDARDH